MLVAISMFYHMPDYEQLTKIQIGRYFTECMQETRYFEFISILIFSYGQEHIIGSHL